MDYGPWSMVYPPLTEIFCRFIDKLPHMKRLLFFLLFTISISAYAQKLPSMEEKTSSFKKYEGYMNFYWDEEKGKIWLDISRLDSELLYMASLPAGLGSNDLGLDRGTVRDTKIIR